VCFERAADGSWIAIEGWKKIVDAGIWSISTPLLFK
jgi:hypothetical protein